MPTVLIPQSQVPALPAFSLRIATEAFYRHKRLFFGCCFGITLLALLASALMKKQYTSEMKFLVQNARGNVVITPERTNPLNVVTDVTESQVNSEIEILRSHDVLDPVADPSWANLVDRSSDAIAHHQALLAAFDKKLEVEPIRKTNVISVGLRADSPEQASDSLHRLASAYLGQHRRMQRPVGSSAFFTSEAERYRKEWDEATRTLVSFQQEHQLSSLQQREADLEIKINKAGDDLLASGASIGEADGRLKETDARIQATSARQTTQDTAQPYTQSMQQLTAVITDLENRRTVLLSNYKPDDRLVREIDRQITLTKAQYEQAASAKAHQVTTDVDPVWQQLRTEHAQASLARRSAVARQSAVVVQIDGLKTELGKLQDLDVQFNNLEAKVKERKENYDLYAEKRDQSLISDAMDDRGLMNVVVAQNPTTSYLPSRPKLLVNFLLGIITALSFACCATYLAEVGRNTVATPRELDSASRYPVLATLGATAAPGLKKIEGTIIDREYSMVPVVVQKRSQSAIGLRDLYPE
ncbi:MAG TPA: Wzz/FepE/Etk N-terminal domain-containing protein [Terriglobales bacterium]|nr:Wzz/FepE/Etk N-terminal domain-containing protein [Terriglobales bacterium]